MDNRNSYQAAAPIARPGVTKAVRSMLLEILPEQFVPAQGLSGWQKDALEFQFYQYDSGLQNVSFLPNALPEVKFVLKGTELVVGSRV